MKKRGVLFIQNQVHATHLNQHYELTEEMCLEMLHAADDFYQGPFGIGLNPDPEKQKKFTQGLQEALNVIRDVYSNSLVLYFCIRYSSQKSFVVGIVSKNVILEDS